MLIKGNARMLLAANKGNEGSTPPPPTTQDDAPKTTDDATGTNGGTDTKSTSPAKSFATEADFQAEVDRLLKDRLDRAETKAKETARIAAEKLEADAAAKNGEWQTLAEKRGTALAALEAEKASLSEQADTQKTTLARYEKALTAHVTSLIGDVPEGVKVLLKKLDPVEQLEWLSANGDATKQNKQGVPATPDANVSMDATQQDAARKQFGRLYNNF